MDEQKYAPLKLEHQLCFPLYACSREIIKQYKPFLDGLGLTYTQYITMLVLWERRTLTVKELGSILYLDSGTLTPLLKKLEQRGLITRCRPPEDERSLVVSLTVAGEILQEHALTIPAQMARSIRLEPEEATALRHLLYKLLGQPNAGDEPL